MLEIKTRLPFWSWRPAPLNANVLQTSLFQTSLFKTFILQTSFLQTSVLQTSVLQTSSCVSSSPSTSVCVRHSHLVNLCNNRSGPGAWVLAPGGLLPRCSPGPSQSCSTCLPAAHLSSALSFPGCWISSFSRPSTTSRCLFSLISSRHPGDLRLWAAAPLSTPLPHVLVSLPFPRYPHHKQAFNS